MVAARKRRIVHHEIRTMPFRRHKFKSSILIWLGLAGWALMLPACRGAESPGPAASPASPAMATPTPAAANESRPVILAFGDSLTAGYGLPEEQSYPVLLQQRLEREGYRYRVVNAGVSGDTTAGGLRRLEWSLQDKAQLVILALGGNDGLRGQPAREMKKNLAGMIELAQSRGATVVLAGMEAPPNLGPDYTREFRQVYRDLAREYRTPLIPFLLDGIGGRPEYNQADGIHPNAEGEKLMVDNVWRVIEPLLKK